MSGRERFCATFSIVGMDERTGTVGAAIASAIIGVGGLCCRARAGVGVVVSQSWVNPYLGVDVLNGLERGWDPERAVARAVAGDERASVRQVGVVGAAGGLAASYTGRDCTPVAGQLHGAGYAIQGNMLTDDRVLHAMRRRWLSERGAHGAAPLARRLLGALTAGDAQGGDRRGRQSAAVLVVGSGRHPLVDLRVDEHPEPVTELGRILALAERQLFPFTDALPTRDDTAREIPPAVSQMLRLPVERRPGHGGHG